MVYPEESVPSESVTRYSPQHGWVKADRLLSVNGGSVCKEDVTLAFQLLKERNKKLMCPPVFVDGENESRHVVQATALHEDALWLRCWPTKKREKRSMHPVSHLNCTVVVESEFGKDADGSFDIPIITCVILGDNHNDFRSEAS